MNFTTFRFCRHDWNKWSDVMPAYGGSMHQVCECKKCGAVINRKAVSMFSAQLEASLINKIIAKVRDIAANAETPT